MNRRQLTAAACVAGVLMFVIGLAATFPVDRVATQAAGRLGQTLGMPVILSPLRTTWRGLAAERLDVRTPDGALTLHDLRLPWSWQMLTGLSLEAGIGTAGTVELSASRSGDVALRVDEVMLEDLPLHLPAEARLLGRISGEARVAGLDFHPGVVPSGQLDFKAQGVEVRNVKFAGSPLPPLHLDTAAGRAILEQGRSGGPPGMASIQQATVRVDSLTFQGDAQGNVTGTVLVNPPRPTDSRLNLNVSLVVQRGWLNQLGDLRAVAEGFLPGGRLDGVLQGTLSAPSFAPAARR